jgi:hypothetical protein
MTDSIIDSLNVSNVKHPKVHVRDEIKRGLSLLDAKEVRVLIYIIHARQCENCMNKGRFTVYIEEDFDNLKPIK